MATAKLKRKPGVMEWGVMRAAIPLGCCVVGVVESWELRVELVFSF